MEQAKAAVKDLLTERRHCAAKMHLNGMSTREIAEKLGVTEQSARRYLGDANLIHEKQDPLTRKQEILSALACGWTWSEVCRELYVSMTTISALLQKHTSKKFFFMPKPSEIESVKNRLLLIRLCNLGLLDSTEINSEAT